MKNKNNGMRVTQPEAISSGGYYITAATASNVDLFDDGRVREYRYTCMTSTHTYTIRATESYDDTGVALLGGLPRHKDARFLLFALASIQCDQVSTGDKTITSKTLTWRKLVEGAGLTYCGDNKARAELAMKRYSALEISLKQNDGVPIKNGTISWAQLSIISVVATKSQVTINLDPAYVKLFNTKKRQISKRFLCLDHFNSMTPLESRLFELIQSRLRKKNAASFWTTPERIWETLYGIGYKQPRQSNIVNRLRQALAGIGRKTQSDEYAYRVGLEKNGYGKTQKIRFVLGSEPDVWNYPPDKLTQASRSTTSQDIDAGLDDFNSIDILHTPDPSGELPF